jgi:hypothetical protein
MSAIEHHSTELELAEKRNRTAVGKHPDRALIEALLARGRSAFWIEGWLEERYPDTDVDDDGQEIDADDAVEMRKLHVTEDALESYRRDWMPELAPGVDMVYDDIEEIIGRRFPGALRGPQFEVDLIETVINTAQFALGKSLQQDDEMGMIQQTTLDVLKTLQGAATASVDVKQKLGLPGYEPLPEHQIIETNNRHVSVELHGRAGKDGQRVASDQGLVDVALRLLAEPKERAAEIIRDAKQAMEPPIDSTATEVPDGG